MKLTHVRVKDFRSFAGEHQFDLSSGVNYFVGPNNCGKSNLIAAIELGLDPEVPYILDRDRPDTGSGVGAPPKTRITLTFRSEGKGPESTLLSRARDYERAVRSRRGDRSSKTYADDGEVRLLTSFGKDGQRQTSFLTKGAGGGALGTGSDLFDRLESQFRQVLRFAVVHSGEDLESLLKGKFREILGLVIKDHLSTELSQAERERAEYVDALQSVLFEPLRAKILELVGETFQEITVSDLIPEVPTLGETLSSVDVQLGDRTATTELKRKGTGVRGVVLVSMLQYLAEQSRRSLVLAVEEPEAFLHPGAQESIRGHLERLASRTDVSLLVTTHSPYVISRRDDASITELRKDANGSSIAVATAAGCEDRAERLGSLYRDAGLAHVLERSLDVPSGTQAVLITEGYTDGFFLRTVCEATGRADLLAELHIIEAGSASKVVPQAILAKAATEVPVIALVDNDDNGRAARDKLKSFNWDPKKSILCLSAWPGACSQHDTEIEDLLPTQAVEKLVSKLGRDAALDGTTKCGESWHLQLSKSWKEAAIGSLAGQLTKEDAGGMIWLTEEIWKRADKIKGAKAKAGQHERTTSAAQAGNP